MWYPTKIEIFWRPETSACTWKTYWNITNRVWGDDMTRLMLIFLGVFGIEIMWSQTQRAWLKKRYPKTSVHLHRQFKEGINPLNGKLTQEHIEECTGCALCEADE